MMMAAAGIVGPMLGKILDPPPVEISITSAKVRESVSMKMPGLLIRVSPETASKEKQ
jgi:hypothetical protein